MASRAARDRILRAATAASSTSEPLTRPAAEALAKTLRLAADPTRLQLLSMINGSPGQEVTVGELTRYLGLRQPTISHHLRLMYEDGCSTVSNAVATCGTRSRRIVATPSPTSYDERAAEFGATMVCDPTRPRRC